MNAVRVAVGLGAHVRLLDRGAAKLRRADELFGARCETAFATPDEITKAATQADIVVGAAMVAGRRAPLILTREHLRAMRPGSVLVDVAIDQGGIAETSRPTTHSDPFYLDEGIVHYCVTNMPGAVARTATLALTHATLPFVMALAEKGLAAAEENPHLGMGLQIRDGKIVYPGLGSACCCAFTTRSSPRARAPCRRKVAHREPHRDDDGGRHGRARFPGARDRGLAAAAP